MMSFFVTQSYAHGDRLSFGTLFIHSMFRRLGFVLECMNVDLGYWTSVYHAFKCKHQNHSSQKTPANKLYQALDTQTIINAGSFIVGYSV